VITAENLVKRFGSDHVAVNDVSFHVAPGEIMCLYGANGAGKTTTINMFLNFLQPSSGRAVISGIDATAQPLLARRHLGFLSESVRLYDNFTAMQNILFFSRLGNEQAVGVEQCTAMLSECGLDGKFHHRRVGTFSKGMRQKAAFAICRIRNAKALFLDEPLSGLDPSAADSVLDSIRKLCDAGAAVLMSTHDLLRSSEIADKVALMKSGQLLARFSQAELKNVNLTQLYREAIN